MNAAAPVNETRRGGVQHRLRQMMGRDPGEGHRSATPLELLFDLTLVVAFAQAGSEAAHLIAEGHVVSAIFAFAFVMFAVCWAWINFSWFASAFDTDDWFYRVTVMVQMVGVLVLALGIPDVFDSVDAGGVINNNVVVAGYIVMRVAMLSQWIRVALQDPAHRRVALGYAITISVSQIGWTAALFFNLTAVAFVPLALVLVGIEMLGPILAERRDGGTPWHPHHIAERYGLLVIITLGEGILGTIVAVAALVDHVGWSPGGGARDDRRHRPHLRSVVELLHHPVGRSSRTPTGAVVGVGLWAHSAARRYGGDRRRHPRCCLRRRR